MKKILLLCIIVLISMSCQTETLSERDVEESSQSNVNDELPDTDNSCETLFAFGGEQQSTCFIENGFNRWGWTIGPLTDGTYNFDLYSGAGQCDIDKGTLVGLLNVTYNEDLETLDVEYSMFGGYVLSETHLYVGNAPYPVRPNGNPTVAPGQFPYKNQLNDVAFDAYPLFDITGEIYIIAHGVVCEDDNGTIGG